jgi:hypothetical protein
MAPIVMPDSWPEEPYSRRLPSIHSDIKVRNELNLTSGGDQQIEGAVAELMMKEVRNGRRTRAVALALSGRAPPPCQASEPLRHSASAVSQSRRRRAAACALREGTASGRAPAPSSCGKGLSALPARLPRVVKQFVQIRSAEIASAEDDTFYLRGVVHVGKWVAPDEDE